MRKYFLIFVLILTVCAGALHAGDITPNGMYQGDLYTFLSNVVTAVNEAKADFNLSRTALNTMCMGSVGIASHGVQIKLGQSATTLPGYVISGLAYNTASIAVSLAGGDQATLTKRFYLISIDAAGTATCTAGTAVASTLTPAMHAPPASHCPIAGVYITASGTFTPGTTVPFSGAMPAPTLVNIGVLDLGSAISASDLSLSGL